MRILSLLNTNSSSFPPFLRHSSPSLSLSPSTLTSCIHQRTLIASTSSYIQLASENSHNVRHACTVKQNEQRQPYRKRTTMVHVYSYLVSPYDSHHDGSTLFLMLKGLLIILPEVQAQRDRIATL